MKTRLWTAIFVLLGALVLRAQTNDLTALLQQGLLEEQANRNLNAAIADYQSLALQFDKNRQLAATAVFRLGECYRAQGRTNEAAVQYQRVIHDFSDQQSLVTLSRQDLTGMGFSESATKTTAGEGGSSEPHVATAEALSLATQISGIEKLKADPEEQARAVLAIFPDDNLKDMLLNLPKLQDQVARVKANPQLTYMELLNTSGFRTAVGSEMDRVALFHPPVTNLLAFAQLELDKQQHAIQERVNFILGVQQARLKALQAANGSGVPGVSQNEATSIVTSDEDWEIQHIQKMIQNSPDLINSVSDMSTPLVMAAYKGWLKVAAYLLDHGADVNVSSPDVSWTSDFHEAGPVTPLVAAVLVGNKAMTKFLIEHGADINFKGLNGNAPLHWAARKGYQSVTEVLLASHADVNIQNNQGTTPLFSAAEAGQLKTLQMLLAAGADVNFKNGKGWTALNYAIGTTPEVVHALLDAGTNPNTVDWIGRTPLSYAAEKDSPKVVKLLLDAKADPNGGTMDPPLLSAIHEKKLESAELLLQAGADPNKKSPVDWSMIFGSRGYPVGGQFTPMFLAVESKQFPMVQLLLKYKADPNDSQSDDHPTLFNALSDTNILAALLEAGANANTRNQNGFTVLAEAVNQKNVGAVQLLLKHKVNPNDSQIGGHSILFEAVSETNILKALLDADANVDPIKNDGRNQTPLGAAVFDANDVAVEMLLKHGANPNARNPNGETPLHWAAYRLADADIFDLLLRYKADPNVRSNNARTPLDELKKALIDQNRFSSFAAQQARIKELITLLHQHGALDNLPDWDRISYSRPADQYTKPVFTRGTNDWNHFTLLEMIYSIYPNMNSTTLDGNSSAFPDLIHIVIARPSKQGSAIQRIPVNLLTATNQVDCSRDVPLEFGDVVEIPEREHSLADGTTYLSSDQERSLIYYFRDRAGEATLVVDGGQTVQLPLQAFYSQIGFVLSKKDARAALSSNSDLSRVKVTRRDPQTNKTFEWTVDCTKSAPDLWLRAGDVIEVPLKS